MNSLISEPMIARCVLARMPEINGAQGVLGFYVSMPVSALALPLFEVDRRFLSSKVRRLTRRWRRGSAAPYVKPTLTAGCMGSMLSYKRWSIRVIMMPEIDDFDFRFRVDLYAKPDGVAK